MVAMGAMPVMAIVSGIQVENDEMGLTDVVANLGISNMLGLQEVLTDFATDGNLDDLNDYLASNYPALKAAIDEDGVTTAMLKDLMDDIEGVNLEGITVDSDAANEIFKHKDAVITTLGNIVDRIVTARGGEENSAYAYEVIINHLLEETAVVTYDTSTGEYSLDFSEYKNDSQLLYDMSIIMPFTFPTANKTDFIDDIEGYLEYILNSTYFDGNETDFNASIDSYNGGAFYNEYTPAGGGGGGGGGFVLPEVPEEPAVEDPVVEETGDDETTVTSAIGNAATVTENEDGTEEAVLDEDALAQAIEDVVDAADSVETEEGDIIRSVISMDIENETADVSVVIAAGDAESFCDNNINISINTHDISYGMPSGLIDVENFVDDQGRGVDSQCDFRFNSAEVNAETLLEGIGRTSQDGLALAEAVEDMSKIIEFSLDMYRNDSLAAEVHDFDKPLTIRISLADIPDADPDKLGAYYIDEDTGVPVFMGGKIVTVNGVSMIEFSTMHLSKFAVLEGQAAYPDVSSHWSKKYVESMGDKHIVAGYTDGTFLPEKAVTRAEFAKMVVETMRYEAVEYTGDYPDVLEGDWYAGYVATAEANGIVLGYPDGTFKPNQNINRLVMATMLSRAYDNSLLEPEAKVLASFSDDSAIADWGRVSAAKAVEAGFINGMNGTFNPEGTTTRAQAAAVIYRLFNK